MVILLNGCAPASARALDPSSDRDCALTAYFFHEVAAHTQGQEKEALALHILNQWFAVRNNRAGTTSGKADVAAISNAIESDLPAARKELNACMARATQDSRFDAFADQLGWRRTK